MEQEGLLTVKNLSRYFQVSPSCIYALVEGRSIPHKRLPGGGIRFSREEINIWLDSLSISSSPIAPNTAFQIIDNKENISKNFLTNPPFEPILRTGGKRAMAKAKSMARVNCGYGAIFQRSSKDGKRVRWYLDYRGPDGKRVQRVAKLAMTKEEAMLALQEERRRAFDKEYEVIRRSKQTSFGELSARYIEEYAKTHKKSWKDDEYRIKASMNPFLGDRMLRDITVPLIESYVRHRLEVGVSQPSVNRELTIMKKMFGLAADWGLADKNPLSRVKLFKEAGRAKQRILELDEERALIAKCPSYLKPILFTALNTGMRRGEILGLKWTDVDLAAGILTVRETKNGKPRLIPINDALASELRGIRAVGPDSELVFPNPETGKPFVDIKKSFKAVCAEVGIFDLRFHDLRHTYATRLVEAGADVATVWDILGHSSIKVTDRYTHSNLDRMKKAVRLLAEKQAETPENGAGLLHICDISEAEKTGVPIKGSQAIN